VCFRDCLIRAVTSVFLILLLWACACRALRSQQYLSEFTSEPYHVLLSDFNLICYLATKVGTSLGARRGLFFFFFFKTRAYAFTHFLFHVHWRACAPFFRPVVRNTARALLCPARLTLLLSLSLSTSLVPLPLQFDPQIIADICMHMREKKPFSQKLIDAIDGAMIRHNLLALSGPR
jgi:hypothetical protein